MSTKSTAPAKKQKPESDGTPRMAQRRDCDEAVQTKKRKQAEKTAVPLPLGVDRNNPSQPKAITATNSSGSNNTTNSNSNTSETAVEKKDTHRVRKKKRKKAQKHQELVLAFAQEAQYTGSVVVADPTGSLHVAQHQQYQSPIAIAAPSVPRSICVTTSSRLPKFDRPSRTLVQNVGRLQQAATTNNDSSVIQVAVQPLLILDLNGILCHRIRKRKEPEGILAYRQSSSSSQSTSNITIAGTPVIPRPHLHEFLSFLDAHFCLAVWTSAKPKTAKQLVAALFPDHVAQKLLFVWGQNRCKATGEQHESETVFEKELHKVWNDFPLWNQFNTLLLDDSPEKCDSFRHNALHPPPMHGQQSVSKAMIEANPQWALDEENHRLQMDFFSNLVDYWNDKDHLSKTTWNELGDIQCSQESERIWTFLQNNAMEHMGWRM